MSSFDPWHKRWNGEISIVMLIRKLTLKYYNIEEAINVHSGCVENIGRYLFQIISNLYLIDLLFAKVVVC